MEEFMNILKRTFTLLKVIKSKRLTGVIPSLPPFPELVSSPKELKCMLVLSAIK